MTISVGHESSHHLHLWRILKSTGLRVANSIRLNNEAAYPPYIILTDNFGSFSLNSDRYPRIHIFKIFLQTHKGYEYTFYLF